MKKKVFDLILNAITILAPFPTGWAVFAGLVEKSVWPMPSWVAIAGALALVAVTVSISSFIIETVQYNQSLRRKDEADGSQSIPTWYGWTLLVFAVMAEITLTLLIVIFPGLRTYAVVAFPLLSLAGMFAFVLRNNLAERLQERDKARAERRISKVSAIAENAPAMHKRRTDVQKRLLCIDLQTQFACAEPACEWKPVLEKLLASEDPERSAVNARTAHHMHKHPAGILVGEEVRK